jgi:LSD1 subclass zinc finger protein
MRRRSPHIAPSGHLVLNFGLAVGLLPVQDLAKALAQRHRCAEAQRGGCPDWRADGMSNVTGGCRTMVQLRYGATEIGNGACQIQDAGRCAGADVEDVEDGRFGGGGRIAVSSAATTSVTKMKSRVCAPSPKMSSGVPCAACRQKMEITPEYGEFGS